MPDPLFQNFWKLSTPRDPTRKNDREDLVTLHPVGDVARTLKAPFSVSTG